jgi:hypothetical protein
MATMISTLYGDDSSPWGDYGGDISYGEIEWSAGNGAANIEISLDPGFSIFGFSFNTNVNSNDFLINVQDVNDWFYRGLNTTEGIGTDLFDYSVWRQNVGWNSILPEDNNLTLNISGLNITKDDDLYEPNILLRNLADWDAILHRSHFGIYAKNSQGTNYILSDIFTEHNPPVPVSVPEPGTFFLLLIGFIALFLCQKKITKHKGLSIIE